MVSPQHRLEEQFLGALIDSKVESLEGYPHDQRRPIRLVETAQAFALCHLSNAIQHIAVWGMRHLRAVQRRDSG